MAKLDKLYLAQPLSMRKEVRRWELCFEHETGIELVNPFYDTDRDDILKLDKGLFIPRQMKTKEGGMKIVEADLELIRNSQGIVAFLETGKESLGTPMEIFFNSYVLGRPTYVITKSTAGHPWIKGLATKVFNDKQKFATYIIDKD